MITNKMYVAVARNASLPFYSRIAYLLKELRVIDAVS